MYDRCWEQNLSWKRFLLNYGEAVDADEFLKDGCWEWRRKVRRGRIWDEVFCNPEDVVATDLCAHDATTVCSRCRIPICNECWTLACLNRPIPKAFCNDNFTGYIHAFFVQNDVTWIEAIIACPVFTGLITYYIEGNWDERHHLMSDIVAKPCLLYTSDAADE